MIKTKLLFTICLIVFLATTVFSQKPTITTTSPIPAGTVGVPYTDTLKATGPAPITWSVTGLPVWATLTDSVISGTPTATGTFTLHDTATNINGSTGSTLSLTIVPSDVPSVYTQVYGQLQTDISDLSDTIHKLWSGKIDSTVLYAGQLANANCNNGPALVNSPGSFKLIIEDLLGWKAIGAKAISLEVSFPMLYAPYLNSVQAGLQNKFLTFYKQLADTIRYYGFKLIVECQSIDAGSDSLQSNWPNLSSFYASIPNFKTYIADRSSTAALVASTLKPDFIVLQEEPSTETQNSKQPTFIVDSATVMLDSSLAAVRRLAIPGMKIGAGFGPWLYNYLGFAKSYTQTGCGGGQPCINTPLDFLDLHIFPIIKDAVHCDYPFGNCPAGSDNFQSNLLNCLNIARAANIPVTVSQSWLRKTTNTDWESIKDPPWSSGTVEEAREPYSFWIPEDTAFLHLDYDIANYTKMLFFLPFNTSAMSTYIQWTNTNSIKNDCEDTNITCGSLSPIKIYQTEQRNANDSLYGAVYTNVAQSWHDRIVSPADNIAPTAPSGFIVRGRPSSTKDTLTWNAGTDNVGVAGYHIWRIHGIDTIQLHDILQSPKIDSGLTIGYGYCYQVQAFDLAGHISGKTLACGPAGVDNLQIQNGISIYPNPSAGIFVVDDYVSGQKLLQVYDMVGKLVHTEIIKSEKIIIDLSNLALGVYTVRISNNEGSINKRLIIVR